MTTIEWTDVTWNPTTGCDKVSPGCDHCYAMTMAKRLKGMGSAKYQRDGDPKTSGPGFGVSMHWDTLPDPFSWRKPRRVFVNSMSDLFHQDVSDQFIVIVFAVMSLTPQHTYQILTKRHARMRSLLSRKDFEPRVREEARLMKYSGDPDPRMDDRNYQTWPLPNVWLGASVEDQKWADIRIPVLVDTPAAIRFLSCEPLLGPVDLHGCTTMGALVDWVIVGGESGRESRPMHPQWARDIRDQCTSSGVAFLFKQWGEWATQFRRGDSWAGREPDAWVKFDDGRVGTEAQAERDGGRWTGVYRVGKKAAGRELDGRTWDEYPA